MENVTFDIRWKDELIAKGFTSLEAVQEYLAARTPEDLDWIAGWTHGREGKPK